MADDLAARLVHAAAEAITETRYAGGRVASAAVVAVLDVLADEPDVMLWWTRGHGGDMARTLADRVKEEARS